MGGMSQLSKLKIIERSIIIPLNSEQSDSMILAT